MTKKQHVRPNQALKGVAIITPIYNEALELRRFHKTISALTPPPHEVVLVDGGSTDGSVVIAQELGFKVITSKIKGRAAQINLGIDNIQSPLVMVLHADSAPPVDCVTVIQHVLRDEKISLAGFTPLLSGPDKTRWLTSFHNWIKTWYAPLLFRPYHFIKGGRLLFGDHAMFFRRDDFIKLGGCDPSLLVMEDADLCLKFTKLGRTRLIRRITHTSDRRIEKWGGFKSNMIFIFIAIAWGFGFKHVVSRFYPDIRDQ